jgi:hypothetical protein
VGFCVMPEEVVGAQALALAGPHLRQVLWHDGKHRPCCPQPA